MDSKSNTPRTVVQGNTKKTEVIKVRGMTCAGCERTIQTKLSQMKGVTDVFVSQGKGHVKVTYDVEKISLERIKKKIQSLGYEVNPQGTENLLEQIRQIAKPAIFIIIGYLILKYSGVGYLFNLFPEAEAGMEYGMIFVVGLLTSVHCVAMCGGINLSQCMSHYSAGQNVPTTTLGLIKSNLLYHGGRVFSYTVIGGIIGAAGSVIRLTGAAKGGIQLAAGVFMVIMGLNMMHLFAWFSPFVPKMPKLFTRNIDAPKSKKRPFYIGLLNGLMPCGPLQAMQLYALSAQDPAKGALAMFLFAIGTVPLLFLVGAFSTLITQKHAKKLLSAGAMMVVVMGGSMFMNGLSLSGIAALSPITAKDQIDQTEMVDQVQVVNTMLDPRGYEPIAVTQGIPVKWTITAGPGTITGCNNRIYIPEYDIEKRLEPGENIIEFTPSKTGKFVYSCWMGMIRSTITVVAKAE